MTKLLDFLDWAWSLPGLHSVIVTFATAFWLISAAALLFVIVATWPWVLLVAASVTPVYYVYKYNKEKTDD